MLAKIKDQRVKKKDQTSKGATVDEFDPPPWCSRNIDLERAPIFSRNDAFPEFLNVLHPDHKRRMSNEEMISLEMPFHYNYKIHQPNC